MEAFAAVSSINATVQLFEMSIGLRSQFDFKLLIEQGVATLVGGKINSSLSGLNKNLLSPIDQLSKDGICAAFGFQENPAELAQARGSSL